MKRIFQYDNEICYFNLSKYDNNGRLAVLVKDINELPMATLSCNVSSASLAPDEFCVKIWSENEMLAQIAKATGYFEDTGLIVEVGYCNSPIWKVKPFTVKDMAEKIRAKFHGLAAAVHMVESGNGILCVENLYVNLREGQYMSQELIEALK